MKFVKGISLFLIGFLLGVRMTHFFYPGEQSVQEIQEPTREMTQEPAQESTREPVMELDFDSVAEQEDVVKHVPSSEESLEATREVSEVSSSGETLSADTEYVLEETDLLTGSVVETTLRLPDKYMGLNREQFLEAMESYESFPPLTEMERGFVSLEVLSFSREKVVVQMNYQYVQPSTSFYLAVKDNEVVVYLEDMETIFINTGIELTSLPEDIQQEVIQVIWIEDEESLYNFLENYSS